MTKPGSHSRRPTWAAAAALVTMAGARAAAAQPAGNVPLEVPEYDPSQQFTEPAKPEPRAPVVITIGPDGRPVDSAPSGPTGIYHYGTITTPQGDDVIVNTGPTPELHVVRRGDTLWDICWYYFNDPWQWPKVWSYNAQITNPHWIYPGDLVRLLPKGMLDVVDSGDPGLDPDANPDGGGANPPVAPVPARRFEVSVRQTAFVDKKHLDSSMFVVGSVDDKELLATGDEVYVSYPADHVPRVGDRYSVYAEDQPVNRPGKGGEVLGSYVRVLGDLQITAVKRDKRANARITSASSEIERGSRVGPLQRQYRTVAPTANKVDAQGTIVAMLTRDQLIGTGEVVFVDLGKKSGIEVGNRMYVVRRGDAFDPVTRPDQLVGQDDRAFPARSLGQVVIVQVGPSISVGLVTLAFEEMGIGDLVMMRKE